MRRLIVAAALVTGLLAAAIAAGAGGAAIDLPATPAPTPAAANETSGATAATPAAPAPAATNAPAAKAPETKPAAPTAAEKAEADKKAQAEAARKAQEQARLRQSMAAAKSSIEFQDTPVKDILTYLAEVGKFSIVFDKALQEAGIDLAHVPASIKASGLSYEQAIQLVLPRECGYRIEAGYVLVTTLEKSWLPLTLRSYDVHMAMAEIPDFGGLAPRFQLNQAGTQKGGGGTLFTQPQAAAEQPPVTPDRIIALIKQFVRNSDDPRIAPWSDDGGPASISYLGGYLIVSQTYVGHMKVMRIIAMIE
jgi:hypothetical protein